MESIQSLEAQIAELEAKKRALEEEEARKARSIHITIHKFNPITGKIHLTLSKYRPDIVDYLRYYMDRAWVGDESSNIVSTFNLEHHLEELERKGDVILQWNKNDKEKWDEYKNAPDIAVSVNEDKSYVLLKLGPKIRPNQFWLSQEIATLTVTTEGIRFSLAEFHAFPDSIAKLYPSYTVTYSDRAREILTEQLNRIKVLSELANAKDAPDILNPFSGIDSSTDKPYDLAPHQRVAVKFIEISGGNGIVAYDMGTGKSAIGIALTERAKYKRTLIICPASLKTNWKREIKKFTGKDAIVFQGVEPDELSIDIWADGKADYYIINYDIIGRGYKKSDKAEERENNKFDMKWVVLFSTIKPDFIITDEGHYIKNMESARSKGVLTLGENCYAKTQSAT